MFTNIFALIACSTSSTTVTQESVFRTDDTGVNDSFEQSELNGTLITDGIPAPEFQVLNQDGLERTKTDLLGKPTVIWFYPAANTPG